MVPLLVYVGLWLPISVCFVKHTKAGALRSNLTPLEALDYGVDCLFALDLLINFFTAFEDPHTGLLVTNHKAIAANYLSGWFIIDLVSVLPVQFMEQLTPGKGNGESFELARLLRIPRLWKIARVLRMLKMVRVLRRSERVTSWFDGLRFDVGEIRMLKVLSL
jgi:hypothetical protein